MEDVHMHDQHVDPHKIEEEVKKHLEEAERNKLLNAQLQKEQNIMSNIQQSNFHDQLNQRLDQTQQELDEEERKHQEFLKKRKEHYKNEMKAAMLLKKQSPDDEEEEEDK